MLGHARKDVWAQGAGWHCTRWQSKEKSSGGSCTRGAAVLTLSGRTRRGGLPLDRVNAMQARWAEVILKGQARKCGPFIPRNPPPLAALRLFYSVSATSNKDEFKIPNPLSRVSSEAPTPSSSPTIWPDEPLNNLPTSASSSPLQHSPLIWGKPVPHNPDPTP